MGTTLMDLLGNATRSFEAKGLVFRDGDDIRVELQYKPGSLLIKLPEGEYGFGPYLPRILLFKVDKWIPMEAGGKESHLATEMGAQVFCLFDPRFYAKVKVRSPQQYVDENLMSGESWEVIGEFASLDILENLPLQHYQREWLSRMMGADEANETYHKVVFRFKGKELQEMEQPDLAPFEHSRVKVEFRPLDITNNLATL